MNTKLVTLLEQGDKRTVKGVEDAVNVILENPSQIRELLDAFSDTNEELNMRCADTLQKVFSKQPSLLQPYKKELLSILLQYDQKEVRWHMAQILPSLQLTNKESLQAFNIWGKDFHTSNSSILKTFSL